METSGAAPPIKKIARNAAAAAPKQKQEPTTGTNAALGSDKGTQHPLLKENDRWQSGQTGLDGFRWTVVQAKLDDLLEMRWTRLDAVISRSVYSTKLPMTDDLTGEPMMSRSDENASALVKRLEPTTNPTPGRLIRRRVDCSSGSMSIHLNYEMHII
ncbi:adenylate kinase-like [Aedes albopictus]|uniref:Uncharacterized protein n=1 Tax=Aedes albopictus TaxID=7160 RepID=A0ABM1ZJP7_AEDAL